MWQELVAAIGAVLLFTAPFWNGYSNEHLLVLLNAAIAAHVIYLSLSAFAISRVEARTFQRHPQRRWLAFFAGVAAFPSVLLPPILGIGTNLTADRDQLFIGSIVFFCAMWAFLLPAPRRDEADEGAVEETSHQASTAASVQA